MYRPSCLGSTAGDQCTSAVGKPEGLQGSMMSFPLLAVITISVRPCNIGLATIITVLFYDLMTMEPIVWFGLMVFNATFNYISVISWRSVLLLQETGVPEESN